jgi:hypothetical protein
MKGMNMIESSDRRWRWMVVALVVVAAAVVCTVYLLHRKDSAVEEAIAKLQPGMTDAQVQEVLKPVRHRVMPANHGNYEYTFYGEDHGFVIVFMEKHGENTRLTRVIHHPDMGPWWERLRRKWEWRLR